MQIPWLFPKFSFSLTFNKIPWLFPDFCQVWNFPDFSLTAGHPGLVIVLTSSSGTNYVPNEQEDGDQYCSFTIPSKIMPSYSYPENLVDQNEIPIDLSR